MQAAAIAFSDVSKRYGPVLALDRVSFTVPEGEIFGFLGPNGAGKTTAIRLLFDLIRPSSGTASVLGLDCQREGLRARALMGYLPGELSLYEGMRASRVIDLVASLRGSVNRGNVDELCERLALDPSRTVGTYSKGNKQKLGLILAMMHRPPVLVLDEPTSGLDPLVQEEVTRLLEDLAAKGHTIFLSSHDLSEVERMCQRVAFIRRGRIVAVEDVSKLRQRSLHILEVTFGQPVHAGAFDLPGVRETRRDGATVRFEVSSNLDALLKAITRFAVADLRTEQASLDDIFLAYYQDAPSEEREAVPS
jgi:ABC-2 type transport system ATP-binding protein